MCISLATAMGVQKCKRNRKRKRRWVCKKCKRKRNRKR